MTGLTGYRSAMLLKTSNLPPFVCFLLYNGQRSAIRLRGNFGRECAKSRSSIPLDCKSKHFR